MSNYANKPNSKTTVWRNGPEGLILVKTIRGLPYGTERTIFIDSLGEAQRSGIQKSGSGNNEGVTEIKYTLNS